MSLDSKDKGSITDADLEQWSSSVGKVVDKYPEAEVVIPGHGKCSGFDILEHTPELVSQRSVTYNINSGMIKARISADIQFGGCMSNEYCERKRA